MKTIITEKPSVARDIARVLGVNELRNGYLEGNGYCITWAFGHLLELAPPEEYGYTNPPFMPTDFKLIPRRERTEKGYAPDKSVIKQLKIIGQLFERSDEIIAATDAGREGELIFRTIYGYLGCKKPFSRLWINSMTDRAISEGFNNLKNGHDYDYLFMAAEARSRADWVVGLSSSKALHELTGESNNSLGRVQTPVLALICERYLDHKNFAPQPYWTCCITLEKDGISFKINGKEKYSNKAETEELSKNLRGATLKITKAQPREATQDAPLLHDLSSLQQHANKCYGYSAAQTLSIAQKLYEKKLVSYPRTGSRYIPEDVFAEMPSLLELWKTDPVFRKHICGLDMENLNRKSVDNSKITDHYALIVTENKPKPVLKDEEAHIYELILGRMLEAVSPACIKEEMQIEAEAAATVFETKSVKTKYAGWRGVFPSDMEEEKQENENSQQLPELLEGEIFDINGFSILQRKTTPKSLFTEASLLSAMENAGKSKDGQKTLNDCGIGTPATRAGIIETLVKRFYIERDKKLLVPTGKGLKIYQAVKNMRIADVGLTVEWENMLISIEKGAVSSDSFMNSIFTFTCQVIDEISSLQLLDSGLTFVCPKCKLGKMTIQTKVAKCNFSKCNLTLFRNVCGNTISIDQMTKLIKKGKTTLIKGFKSKKGSSFDAYLKFDEQFNVCFEFDKTKGTK